MWTHVQSSIAAVHYKYKQSISKLHRRLGATICKSPQVTILISAMTAFLIAYPFIYSLICSRFVPSLWVQFLTPSPSKPVDFIVKQYWIEADISSSLKDGAFSSAASKFYEFLQTNETAIFDKDTSYFLSPSSRWKEAIGDLVIDNQDATENVHFAALDNVYPVFPSVSKIGTDNGFSRSDALGVTIVSNNNARKISTIDKSMSSFALSDFEPWQAFYKWQEASNFSGSLIRVDRVSLRDNLLLTAAYALLIIYIILSVGNIETVKSKGGLLVAFAVELFLSMSAAATVTSHLAGDKVSNVPWQFVPFLVATIGAENMFRLLGTLDRINAEKSAGYRVKSALEKVGLTSTMSVFIDVFILLYISPHVSPSVSRFCLFTATALLIDLALQFTYFVAVLSIDLRRLELEDLLQADVGTEHYTKDSSRKCFSAYSFLTTSHFPYTTTFGGSTIIICFILFLNMHFPDFNLLSVFSTGKAFRALFSRHSAQSYINSSIFRRDYTLAVWLLSSTSEHFDSCIARIEPPTFYALKGVNQASLIQKEFLLNASQSRLYMAKFFCFSLTIFFGTASVLNYLIRNASEDADYEEDSDVLSMQKDEFLCKELLGHHYLDVFKLCASRSAFLASVSIDRTLCVWKVFGKTGNNRIVDLRLDDMAWPIAKLAISSDEKDPYVAICSRSGSISCINIRSPEDPRYASIEDASLYGTVTCFFSKKESSTQWGVRKKNEKLRLIVVTKNGILHSLNIPEMSLTSYELTPSPIRSSSRLLTPRMQERLVSITDDNTIYVSTSSPVRWFSYKVKTLDPAYFGTSTPSLLPLSQLGMILVAQDTYAEIIDAQSGTSLHSFKIGQFRKGSLKAFHSKPSHCSFCGCQAISSFSMAYTEKDSDMIIMHTAKPISKSRQSICLRAERDPLEKRCSGFEAIIETHHWVSNVICSETSDMNMLIGLCKADESEGGLLVDKPNSLFNSQLQRRKSQVAEHTSSSSRYISERWKGWTMGADGSVRYYHLRTDCAAGLKGHLIVSEIGPSCRIGHRSLAIGYGNAVKVFYFGEEEVSKAMDNTYDDDICLAMRRHKLKKHA